MTRLWHGYKRLTQLGFPRRFVIVQFPSVPLIVAFIAGAVAKDMHGKPHSYASAVAYVGFGVWAYLELTEGVNWFRHLLGAGFLLWTVVQLALALQ